MCIYYPMYQPRIRTFLLIWCRNFRPKLIIYVQQNICKVHNGHDYKKISSAGNKKFHRRKLKIPSVRISYNQAHYSRWQNVGKRSENIVDHDTRYYIQVYLTIRDEISWHAAPIRYTSAAFRSICHKSSEPKPPFWEPVNLMMMNK